MKTLAPVCLLVLQIAAPSFGSDTAGHRSDGCGSAPPVDPLSTTDVGDVSRQFITSIPSSYDPALAHRLIFAFHGRTTPNGQVQRYFQIEQSSTSPTIFVYPAGLMGEDGKYSWYEPGQSGDSLRDYAFFDALLELFSSSYCLDLDQVFIVGHSLGGSFANSLGCSRGSVIRGVGSVAGRIWDAECSGPTATMILHNPHDDLVPLSRGLHARDQALDQNGLEPPARSCPPQALNCECYGPPDAVNPVVWCPHTEDTNRHGEFYPHLWPREAGQAFVDFFDALPALPQ